MCSALYAFNVAESIAGISCAKTGKAQVPLSVQQLIDCSRPFGNEGCEGGLVECLNFEIFLF
jgi:hypothetical protein